MTEQQFKWCQRYLESLDDYRHWDDEDPRMNCGVEAVPYFVAAFERETEPEHRARLTRIIWQFRDAAALPTLAVAVRDPNETIWKDVLDGFVALACQEAITLLTEVRASVAAEPNSREKLSWIDEALEQIPQEMARRAQAGEQPL